MLRLVRITAWTMIWSGSIILGYVAFQLYGTDVVNERAQTEARAVLPGILEQRAGLIETTTSTVADKTPEPEPDPVLVEEPPVDVGEAFAALRIPSIGVDQVVSKANSIARVPPRPTPAIA
jgi:hypothetical protein